MLSNKPFANTILSGAIFKEKWKWNWIYEWFKYKKVLDVGCGEGKSLEYWYKKALLKFVD